MENSSVDPIGTSGSSVVDLLTSWFPAYARSRPQPFAREAAIDFDRSYRSFLYSVLRQLRPEADPAVVSAVRTWGDVLDWFGDLDRPEEIAIALYDVAAMRSPRVRLRPIDEGDLSALYRAACDPVTGSAWRFRGKTPSPAAFESALYDGVHAQFVVADASHDQPLGLVVIYNANLASGHAYFAMYRCAQPHGMSGSMTDAALLMIEFAFRSWPLRKLFLEVPSYNMSLVTTLASMNLAHEEGRLRDYFFFQGSYQDLHIMSIIASNWQLRLAHLYVPKLLNVAGLALADSDGVSPQE